MLHIPQQDFVEDFIFTAAHTEIVRYSKGMCVAAAEPPEGGGAAAAAGGGLGGEGWRGGTLSESESRGILEAASEVRFSGEGREGGREEGRKGGGEGEGEGEGGEG